MRVCSLSMFCEDANICKRITNEIINTVININISECKDEIKYVLSYGNIYQFIFYKFVEAFMEFEIIVYFQIYLSCWNTWIYPKINNKFSFCYKLVFISKFN